MSSEQSGSTSHARPVACDGDTGRLDVVPEAPVYGTKLRWSAPKLISAVNTTVQFALPCQSPLSHCNRPHCGGD
ncbi:hypothetical protein GCM10017771_51250 [Streptomyces capitiformicae]|uniref:Uncharacterized protein n=1 Tax=Streptomyces capitiformicae TaxID=2014920 RepID=A0A919DCY0_9ACTN|nr:hypothetical protein GCM10017771_51250 [Streptomyces capitiformicae]